MRQASRADETSTNQSHKFAGVARRFSSPGTRQPCSRHTVQRCGDAVGYTFDVDVDHVFRILHAQVVQGGDRSMWALLMKNVKLAVALRRQVDETC